MPPKRPGGPSTRGRAGGRAGAAASRSSNSDAPPESSEQTTAIEAPTTAPKQDNSDNDSKLPVTSESIPSADTSAVASPNLDTNSPGRPPVQRLGSLNDSRSASPAVRRGTSSRGKRGMVKPTFTGRRSKEERAALEKEALEREKARTKELQDADRKKKRDADFKAKREAERATRGRGGYSGAMSGPFSLGSSRDDRQTNHRTTSGFGSGSGSQATRIKDEQDGSYGGSGYRSSGGPSIKREGDAVESSDDEEDAEFPRKDIDRIVTVSSDEDEPAVAGRSNKSTLPVRIGRREHQERTIGINTDASTEASAKILEQAEATGQTPAAILTQMSSKGKGKVNVPDAANTKKPFKGVWQDPEELNSPVKTEENSEDETMVDTEQVGIIDTSDQPAEQQPHTSETEQKLKSKIKGIAEPILQTNEDRAEWARFQSNLSHIRAELGPTEHPIEESTDDTAPKRSVRDNNVYLFQIPPLMPELLSHPIKKEPSDNTTTAPAAPPPPPTTSPSNSKNPSPPPSSLDPTIRLGPPSGRTTLDWGGTSYELEPGKRASFLQEVVKVTVLAEGDRIVPEEAGDAVSFGRVKGKFVVVPDWGEMLG
ncbi:hypothetical protein GQ44DRAFT_717398 [Phaeosphaeriaceae sp. PMI808]|nr:hypothetical protein GQ44DRAFT_717398 [Phaeosphaeriaceae sp. PMI808]